MSSKRRMTRLLSFEEMEEACTCNARNDSSTREDRIREAFQTVHDIFNDCSDDYYFEGSAEYFRLKGLYRQATRGDLTGRYWSGTSEAVIRNEHLDLHGMSRIEAMEEYVKAALSCDYAEFSEACKDALYGKPVLRDLGLEVEDSD